MSSPEAPTDDDDAIQQFRGSMKYALTRSTFILNMKLIISTFAPLVIQASWNSIQQDISDLVATTPGLRSIPSFVSALPLLDGWGCYCQFDENSLKGHGTPVNDIDRACKHLAQAYKCSIFDSEEEGDDECEPWAVSYNSTTGMGGQSLLDSCDFRNDNDCAVRSCIIEGHFVVSLFTLLGNGQFVEPQYNHDTFDAASECGAIEQPATGGNGGQGSTGSNGQTNTPDCCGDYPIRYSFNSDNGNKDCCGQHVFNVNVMTCCDDDNVAVTC